MTIKKFILILVVAITVTGLASVAQKEVWDGGFLQVEFILTILDETERPLKGVQLMVLDAQGNKSLSYPVTDFTDESIPSSDENGTMTFHHVSLSPEFGGSCSHLFFLFPVGTCEAPKYTLKLFLADYTVASIKYTDLEAPVRADDWKTLPIIKREWHQKGASSPSLPEHLRIENRKIPPQLAFYVINKTLRTRTSR